MNEESRIDTDEFNEAGYDDLIGEIEAARKEGRLRGLFLVSVFEKSAPPSDSDPSEVGLYAGVFSYAEQNEARNLLMTTHEMSDQLLGERVFNELQELGLPMVGLLLTDEPPSDEAPEADSGIPPVSPQAH